MAETYEITMPKSKFESIVDIRLVRISDSKNKFIVYLDMNETKEFYEIDFV